MNDQFQADALSDALVPHSPDVRPRPDTPLGHLQFRYPQPDPKTLTSLADAIPWMNDVERSKCLLETCRVVERLSPLQRIVFDAERDRCEAGVEDSPDPIVIGIVGALVSGGVRLARDPRWLRLVKGGISLSIEMSALLADVRDTVAGFDYLAYAEANPAEIVEAVRSYDRDGYEHLTLLMHMQQLSRFIPAEDREGDFSGVYGPHGFRVHVFADGQAFSDEEMIDAAIGRFQDHGFRFSGNALYDVAAAMEPEEVTAKTGRALELVAGLTGDDLVRYQEVLNRVLADTRPHDRHPYIDRTAPAYHLYAMLVGLAQVGRIKPLSRENGEQLML